MDTKLHEMTRGELIRLSIRLGAKAIWTRGRSFVYYPRSYESSPAYAKWLTEVDQITFTNRGNPQIAFIDCPPDQAPKSLWLMFGGNGSVALDWLPITSFAPPSCDAFVMMDYPGYGLSKGQPSQKAILRSVDTLILTLCERFKIAPEAIPDRFRVIGHSLGSAVALDTAARYGLKRGILVAPFTSIREMAEIGFGKPLARLLGEKWNNRKMLARLGQREGGEFHIIHGTHDEIVPFRMGKELAETAPNATSFWPVERADHNSILLQISTDIGIALTNGGRFSRNSSEASA